MYDSSGAGTTGRVNMRGFWVNNPVPTVNSPSKANPLWAVIVSSVFSNLNGSTVCRIIFSPCWLAGF